MPGCRSRRREDPAGAADAHQWHPLDDGPAPDYVPAKWTAEHVARRLVEGLKTLAMLPERDRPRGYGRTWVPYSYERADLNSQAESTSPYPRYVKDQKTRYRDKNRVRIQPTCEQVTGMEAALAWLSWLATGDNSLAGEMQAWVRAKAFDRDHSADMRAIRRGLEAIAGELRRRGSRVF